MQSPLHLFRLAALEIRRTLLDLVRKHNGAQKSVTNLDTNLGQENRFERIAGDFDSPVNLAQWTEFHECVERLPDVAKELFDLLWYSGLSQSDAAGLMRINPRTLQRRWRAAKILLVEQWNSEAPEEVQKAHLRLPS